MLERMSGERNSHTLLVGVQTGAATMENSIEIPQKIKNRTTIQSSYSTAPIKGRMDKEGVVYIQRTRKHQCVKIHTPLCSLKHYSQ